MGRAQSKTAKATAAMANSIAAKHNKNNVIMISFLVYQSRLALAPSVPQTDVLLLELQVAYCGVASRNQTDISRFAACRIIILP